MVEVLTTSLATIFLVVDAEVTGVEVVVDVMTLDGVFMVVAVVAAFFPLDDLVDLIDGDGLALRDSTVAIGDSVLVTFFSPGTGDMGDFGGNWSLPSLFFDAFAARLAAFTSDGFMPGANRIDVCVMLSFSRTCCPCGLLIALLASPAAI
ncbi:hypothetical protein BC830DRAFT_1124196 [Chytriomyces sp. MP71]|nr:hypothetical protein BC830DRAFT_1124196 [Chytriomyces sp. MP71]